MRRLESLASLCVGAVALLLIAYATVGSMSEAEGRDAVMAATERPPAKQAAIIAGTASNAPPKQSQPQGQQPLAGSLPPSKLMAPVR
jgi:hypothetical protein